jgi:hypothetical protein
MEANEKSRKIKNVILVIFVLLIIASIVLLILNDGMPWLPSFAALLFILTTVLTIICLVCGFLGANRCDYKTDDASGHASIERKYGFSNFLIVISVSLVVIYILSHVVATLIDFDTSDEDVANFYTAFIALCTTFVVGFQIYSSLDLNRRIDKLDADKRSLEEELKKLNEVTKQSEYYNAYTIGTIRYGDSGVRSQSSDDRRKYCWNALRAYFNALRLAAEGGHDFKETFNALNGKIRDCIRALSVYAENNSGDCKYIYEDKKVLEFIDTISDFIRKTEFVFSTSNITNTNFEKLVKEWTEFKSNVLNTIK